MPSCHTRAAFAPVLYDCVMSEDSWSSTAWVCSSMDSASTSVFSGVNLASISDVERCVGPSGFVVWVADGSPRSPHD